LIWICGGGLSIYFFSVSQSSYPTCSYM
jgi:hypothetical protein